GGAAGIQLELVSHVRVLERDRETLAYRWRRPLLAPLEQVTRLIEDPRLPEGSARNHDSGATGLAMHLDRVFGGLDVAVAQHRNVQCIHNRRDLIPACSATVHLCTRARVQSEHRRTGILTP